MKTCFSMTDLALRGSSFVNGVSQIHGEVARKMFHSIYPGFDVSEVPVKGITNGVHLGTWLAGEWQELYERELGQSWRTENKLPELRKVLDKVSSRELWQTHLTMKRRLISTVKEHIRATYARRGESPAATAAAMTHLNERAIFIGFARRFAPYKRATLLFHHIQRLESLIQAGYPIVILYAGKAHPNDKLGQDYIRQIVEISRKPSLQGRVIFIENYEMDIARQLVQGCDIWLNTPTRPLEASGTSGMKAGINGCLNLSVDDGWWSECYNGKNGWLVSDRKLDENVEFQLEYDSAQIYSLLETEVIPLYFTRNAEGVPEGWVERMKESMLTTTWDFSTARMLRDYKTKFLETALTNAEVLRADTYAPTKKLSALKKHVTEAWERLGFSEVRVDGLEAGKPLSAGTPLTVTAKLQHPGLKAGDLRLQAIVGRPEKEGFLKDFRSFDLKLRGDAVAETSEWSGSFALDHSGAFSVGVRALPDLETQSSRTRVFMHLSKWY